MRLCSLSKGVPTVASEMIIRRVITAICLWMSVFGTYAAQRETRVCTQYKDYSEKIIFFEKAKKAREYIDPNDASYLFYLALIDDPKYMEKIKLACDQSRLPGVRLGMSARQVIEFTNWGKPESISRSSGTWGIRETWAYGDGYYLYFKNNELVDIVN